MKISIKLFLLTALLSFTCLNTFAYDIAVENSDGVTIYYNYTNGGTELEVTNNGYDKYSGSVVIPKEVTFQERTRKVVTSIRNSAFSGSSGLTSITIPNSVRSIGDWAFSGCLGLTSVTIPNSVTSIGRSAFSDCLGLTSISIGNNVTSIGEGAFINCSGLTSITIPNSVTSIGASAFYGCSSLKKVIIKSIAAWCAISFGSWSSNPLSWAYHLYSDENTEITDLVIPNSVTSIGNEAFNWCSGLTSVTIPNSVTSIGNYAFNGCSSLTFVIIPNSVTTIGNNAFSGCSGLTSINIPSSVTSIGSEAFCLIDLTSVTSEIKNPFAISSNIFSEKTFMNATLYVPAGTIDKYKSTLGWKKFMHIEEMEGNVSDGIEVIDEPLSNPIDYAPTYNLRGQRVNKPVKGLFIKNGKKVLMR